jgi:excisionase family DNA binding protein
MDSYIKVAEAAQLLGISQKAFWRRVQRGEVPYRRWGSRILVPKNEFAQFLASLPGVSASKLVQRTEDTYGAR